MRAFADFANQHAHRERAACPALESLPEDVFFAGTSPFPGVKVAEQDDRPPATLHGLCMSRLLSAACHLADHCGLLSRDSELGTLHYKPDHEKIARRDQTMLKLARQRLAEQVSLLEERVQTAALPAQSPWHIVDSAVLMEFWEDLEPLLCSARMRILITMCSLRFLDMSKTDPHKQATARRIMRFISAYSRKAPSVVRLQKPHESQPIEARHSSLLAGLANHHREALSAISYFTDPRREQGGEGGEGGGGSFVILAPETALRKVLDAYGIDYVSEFFSYISSIR